MKKLIGLTINFTIILFLASCANSEFLNAQDETMKDMIASKSRYNDCLMKNSNNLSECEGLKQAYLANVRTLNTLQHRSSYSDDSLEITRQ